MEVPEVATDLNMLRVLQGARRAERPGVSRDVSVVRGSDEDHVGILEEGGRRMEMLRVQETETGEESGLSGEISELVVSKSKVPGRSKGKRRNRQHELEEQVGGQQNQESHLGQPSQDREENLVPCMEGTVQRYRSRTVKHKGLADSLMGHRHRKSQAKYSLERKPSLRSGAGSLAQGRLSLAPQSSLAPGSSVTPGSSLASRVSLVPRVPLVPRVSLAPLVSLGLDSHRSSSLRSENSPCYQEPELEYRQPTIGFSFRPKTACCLSQRSATPCVSLISVFNELAKIGDPDLLEMAEEEGRTAGWR